MPEMKPVLIVIAGPNGSGKSTITNAIRETDLARGLTYINPDVVAEEQFDGWNDPESIKKAADLCQKLRYECLESRQSLMFETVFSSPEKIAFVKEAIAKGFFIRVFFVCTEDPSINAARINLRVRSGGHGVDNGKITSRYIKAIRQIKEILPELDSCHFIDNSIDNQPPRKVFKTKKGVLAKVYQDDIPEWTKAILASVKNQ